MENAPTKTLPSNNVDKEKVKLAYTRQIIGLEILKLKDMPETVEEAEEFYNTVVKTKTYLVDDVASGTPYIIRAAYTENKSKLMTVDPDHLDESDVFEIQESIQDIYRELKLPIIKSQFTENPAMQEPEAKDESA